MPQPPPAAVGMTLAEVDTPALVVDLERVRLRGQRDHRLAGDGGADGARDRCRHGDIANFRRKVAIVEEIERERPDKPLRRGD